VTPLVQLQLDVRRRTEETAAAHGQWPCRKGCDDCCRQLAAAPRITHAEWLPLAAALDALPAEVAAAARHRIRESAGLRRPVVCPLLDTATGACLVYEARPIACRAYGFYAKRCEVLGCHRIETLSCESPGVVWGNHVALEERIKALGPAADLAQWLDAEIDPPA